MIDQVWSSHAKLVWYFWWSKTSMKLRWIPVLAHLNLRSWVVLIHGNVAVLLGMIWLWDVTYHNDLEWYLVRIRYRFVFVRVVKRYSLSLTPLPECSRTHCCALDWTLSAANICQELGQLGLCRTDTTDSLPRCMIWHPSLLMCPSPSCTEKHISFSKDGDGRAPPRP